MQEEDEEEPVVQTSTLISTVVDVDETEQTLAEKRRKERAAEDAGIRVVSNDEYKATVTSSTATVLPQVRTYTCYTTLCNIIVVLLRYLHYHGVMMQL
jgi:CTP:molybdopterin cytidylyltransferase MocA